VLLEILPGFFYCGRICWFCRGFWLKLVAERGFFVVNSWWNAGESWQIDGHFSSVKNTPPFAGLFFADFPFWESAKTARALTVAGHTDLFN
jgi:hypothetical protein